MATSILCLVMVLVGGALLGVAYFEPSLRRDSAWIAVMFIGIMLIMLGLPQLVG